MLENTFIHVSGIGPKTEKRLWERGILTWQHFLCAEGVFSPERDRTVREEVLLSLEHRLDVRYFRDRLHPAEIWRVFEAFKGKAVYLDIETSGGFDGTDDITVIGIFDGRRVSTFIEGFNLHEFEMAVADFDLVITFNGAAFDLPFIRRRFPGISLPPAHIDLRFLLRRLGFQGGLKKIERAFGLLREDDIDGMGGFEAVRLWRAYRWGDREALNKLIRYNTADTVNLQPLMERACGEMRKRLLPHRVQG